jgi:hypothetical protein
MLRKIGYRCSYYDLTSEKLYTVNAKTVRSNFNREEQDSGSFWQNKEPWPAWNTKRVTTNTTKSLIISVAIILLTIVASQNTFVNLAYAETGKGTDIFKVIMSIFGVENTKGDVVAIVAVNDGEASKVKLFETEAFKPVPSNPTSSVLPPKPDSNAGIIEYVATFPNVAVNAGDEYNACVMTTKDLELICKAGLNSPASRPEFIDINLDEVAASGTQQLGTNATTEDIEEETGTVTNDEGSESDD